MAGERLGARAIVEVAVGHCEMCVLDRELGRISLYDLDR
jgi:hypothetical protein